MILYGVTILVLLIRQYAAEVTFLPALSNVNMRELGRLIEIINNHPDEHNSALDYSKQVNHKTKPTIAKLLKKNIKANIAYAFDPDNANDSVRIHVIENHHVLEEFKKNLRKKSLSTSSSDFSDSDIYLDKFLRRNAIFRLDASADVEQPKPKLRKDMEDYYMKNSKENDKKTYSKIDENGNDKKRIVVKFNDVIREDKSNDNTDLKDTDKQTKNDDEQQNVWDMFDDKNKKKDYERGDYNDYKKKSHNDDHNIKDDNAYKKKDYDYNDDYKKKDKSKERYNEGIKKKEYDYNDNYNKDYKKKDDFNDYKKNDSYKKKDNDYNYDYAEKNNDYKNKDQNYSKKDRFKEISQEFRVGLNFDDKQEKNKDGTKNEKEWKSVDYKKQDGVDWDKEIAKSLPEKYPTDNKKTQDRNGGNVKPYISQNYDYYSYQKPKSFQKSVAKAFGRTSIPFVGKKGIYEEK